MSTPTLTVMQIHLNIVVQREKRDAILMRAVSRGRKIWQVESNVRTPALFFFTSSTNCTRLKLGIKFSKWKYSVKVQICNKLRYSYKEKICNYCPTRLFWYNFNMDIIWKTFTIFLLLLDKLLIVSYAKDATETFIIHFVPQRKLRHQVWIKKRVSKWWRHLIVILLKVVKCHVSLLDNV